LEDEVCPVRKGGKLLRHLIRRIQIEHLQEDEGR
jgi:hypothetical protein